MEWQKITSKSNPLLVRVGKLTDKKYRRAEGLFRFDGVKLFEEAVSKDVPLVYVFVSEARASALVPLVEKAFSGKETPACYLLSEDAFLKISEEKSPEGLLCVAKMLDKSVQTDTIERDEKNPAYIRKEKILLLESVRDAGNLGSIVRTATAFGIDRLILSADCADLYNPKTIRAAMGALFVQAITVVPSIPDAVRALRRQGYFVYAAALRREARTLGTFALREGDAVLIGNEGHGLSDEAIDACDACLYIPMGEQSESLGAASAATVCMWELRKSGN